MGSSCCHKKQEDLESTAKEHKKTLWIVLIINLLMFFVELVFGILSNSAALLADSLDMLGDAITYGSSIVVVSMSVTKKAKVAFLKAWIMLIFGLVVSAKCIYKAFALEAPDTSMMISVGGLAFLANLTCLILLNRHKNSDINMKSVWICSRNDIIANTSVICAGFAVAYFHTPYPDILVGIGLSVLFIHSALGIFKDVKETLHRQQES